MAMSLKNKIKSNNTYQQQSKSLCRENPEPGRAQGLCRENRPAAKVPERTTIVLTPYLEIYHWSKFKYELCTISHMMFMSYLKIDQ